MNHAFEAKFEGQCLIEIVSILRAGDVGRQEGLEIAQHAAWFVGCGAKLLAKDGDDEIVGLAAPKEDLAELADELDKAIPTLSGEGAMMAIPWITIVKILLPILIDLFTEEK